MALTLEKKELLEQELQKRRVFDAIQTHGVNVAAKSKFAGFHRSIYEQRAELEREAKLADAAALVEDNPADLRAEERLAFEMQQRKCEEYREAVMRRKLRETAPELKELQRKLNAAYTNKILRAQMREKDAEKLKEKIKDKETGQLLLQSRVSIDEHNRYLKKKEQEQQLKYKQELQDQMIYQEQMKRFKYEEFLREKKFIDDLVQRIHEEDEREQYNKMCEMKRTKEDIEAFQAARAVWKKRNLQMVEEEDRKIKEFIKGKIEVEKKRKSDKSKREQARAQVIDDIAKAIYIERRKKTERMQIVEELNEQEERQEFERKQREKAEKDLRHRIETLSALHAQMQEKKEARRKEAENDAKYKEALIAKIAEDERVELMSREKRRLKMMQIKKDIEQMMAEKRLKKIEEMQALLKMEELRKAEEINRARLVESERIKMLQEHAKNLIGYLPPGVLQESDVQHLGEEFAAKLKCQQN